MRSMDDLNPIRLDGSWLSFVAPLSSISGALLAVGVVAAVGGLVAAAVTMVRSRVFGARISDKALRRVYAACLAAMALGSLSGMVGWGMSLSPIKP